MASSRNSPSEAVAARVAARLGPGATVCAGLSGGLDSVVLLDLLARLRASAGFTLSAVHVHHGLSPNADDWARFCADLCRSLDVALAVERVQVERDSRLGTEAAARESRYAAYARQGAGVVALAHHLDDQAETVLLQLLRGTGLKGASAMPEWRVLPGSTTALFRPLLEVSRSAMLAHARERGLAWIEDESNASSAFDRNFIRARMGPLLDERFPGWKAALARFARHAAVAESLLASFGDDDEDDSDADAARGLPVAELRDLPPEHQGRRLRAFLAAQGLPMPSEARLAEMARQLAGAREDARVRIEHGGAALVRHRDSVRVDRGEAVVEAWQVPWSGEPEVDLGGERGTVRFAPALGQGIAERCIHDRGWHFGPRDGGERIRIDAARPTRTLKNLLQEHEVPAWERARLPLLFHAGALVWVPGIGIAAGYRCAEDEPGRVPEWLPGASSLAFSAPR